MGKNCNLCQNKMTEKDLKLTRDILKEILDVLLIQINFNNKTSLICGTCTRKLLAAFDFKSVCLYTEDAIFPYTDKVETSLLDLKRIYIEGNKNQKEALDDVEICRLCLKPVKVDFISEVNPDVLVKFLPEVNFTVTRNPVICIKCQEALCIHSTFIRNCSEVEKKRNMDIGAIALTNPSIKTEEIEIKPEDDDETLFGIFCNQEIKENGEGDTSLHSQNALIGTEKSKRLHNLDAQSTFENDRSKKCISKTTSKTLAAHELPCSRKNQLKFVTKHFKIEKYQCAKCAYDTRHRRYLVRHQLIHKDPSKVRRFECDECDYKSIHKKSIHNHKLRHKDPSEVPLFKCDECDYKCIQKGSLRIHQLRHKDPSEVHLYKCGECDYKSIRKGNLKTHQLRHKDPSEVPLFKCDECDYKCIQKGGLRIHQLRHKDPSEVHLYKCDECDYKSMQKGNLKTHQLKHKDPSEVRMFKCDECDFKSIRKGSLVRHRSRHQDRSEECSSVKISLKRHMLRHSNYKTTLRRHQL